MFALSREWPDGIRVVTLTATCPDARTTAGAIVPTGSKGFREGSRLLPADGERVRRR